ncbi:helix-turn-helix transcriptional regulator [Vibrio harveyi]|nr:helix-turn-helix transcriptional regulator [Vibrio harveyi]
MQEANNIQREHTMNNGKHDLISIAARIQHAISSNGGYQKISDSTGISVSTLVRMATGKTSPKLTDIIEISLVCNCSLNYIAHGIETQSDIDRAMEQGKKDVEEFFESYRELKDGMLEELAVMQQMQKDVMKTMNELRDKHDQTNK